MVAASLLDHDGLDESDLFARFTPWVAAGPTDVGVRYRIRPKQPELGLRIENPIFGSPPVGDGP
jgi:hypothetical protein